MPVDTGGKMSFMQRFGKQLPKMINQVGQQYGGDFRGAAKLSGGVGDRMRQPGGFFGRPQQGATERGAIGGVPTNTPQSPPPVAPPSPEPVGGMAPSMPIVRGPQFGGFGHGGGPYNTGITGGMNFSPGMMQPQPDSSMTTGDMVHPGALGGLFGNYNRMRPMFG